MVENGTLGAKCQFFAICRRMSTRLKLSLHVQSLQYYIVLTPKMSYSRVSVVIAILLIWDPQNIQKTYILRKLDPFSFQLNLSQVIYYMDDNHVKIKKCIIKLNNKPDIFFFRVPHETILIG